MVRSEAAIGAILECPRCESMVHVVPPPGWVPIPPPIQASVAVDQIAPPPLDHVAEIPLSLEPPPAESSRLSRLLGERWVVWSVTPLALAATGLLVWGLFAQPKPEPAAGGVADRATVRPSKPQKPSAGAVREAAEHAQTSPGPPSAPVDPYATTGRPSGSSERQAQTVAKRETAQPLPSTPSSRPGEAKPPENDPFAAVADATNDNPAKQADQNEIKKAPPQHVDVAGRLAAPIAQLEVTSIPLAKGVDLLAALGALPITMDADALARLGVTPRDRISLRLHDTTVGHALQTAVAQRGLIVSVENGQVLIGAG